MPFLPDWLKRERCRDHNTPENRGKNVDLCEIRAIPAWENGEHIVSHWRCRRCKRIFNESGRITLRNQRK